MFRAYMARGKSNNSSSNSSANIGFEAKLWVAADKLRSNMDAAEYKHVVLGLIFLKYISDSFEEHHAKLLVAEGEYAGANPEDPDEYRAENIFWVPPAARWAYLQNSAKQPTIGKIVDDAMVAIERDNPRWRKMTRLCKASRTGGKAAPSCCAQLMRPCRRRKSRWRHSFTRS
jgi:type I restriction enzyme M protein